MLRRLQDPRRRVVAIAVAGAALAAGLAAPSSALAARAVDDSYNLGSNAMLTVAAPGVLANDDLSCGSERHHSTSVSMASETVHGGTVTHTGGGGFTYTPAPGFTGTDEFLYVAAVRCGEYGMDIDVTQANVQISVVARVVNVFGGFEGPLADRDALFTAGRVIPVVYRVTRDGQPVSDPAHFVGVTSQSGGACGGAAGEVVDAPSVGSGLQYLGDGLWQYNWKTERGFAGQCRTLVLTLADQTQRLSLRFH